MRRKFVVGIFLLTAILLSLALSTPAVADQIVLKNGDRITGSITKSDGKQIVIKTDYAGDVTVKFDAIQSMTSTGDLNVTVDGKTVLGSLTTTGSDVVVATKNGTPVEAPISSVTLVRSPAEQVAYEKTLHPGLAEGWTGGANLGFALTAGNSETKNLNIGFNAVRAGLRDKLTLYETSVYSSTGKVALQPISPSQTTANSSAGGLRYDHDLAGRVFGFGSADFFNNSLQNLDLRYIVGGGIGYHAIKKPNTTLDLLAGINYTHESFSDLTETNPAPPPDTLTYNHSDSTAALTVGDNFTRKVGKNGVFTQAFLLYPSFSQTNIAFPGATPDDVRILRGSLNLGFVTKIHKWLGWQIALTDVFDNHPLASDPPIERNDITLATGLNFSFTH
jgi:putative salt-induced outer membrane protein YdiY